ncbi:MAG: 2-deoxy-D-gluconate 3-dehydrogenase [Roseibacillus sp.]|jgi:NAD(P)-dependent dehydrogenase (short-subunit alcohol dehydrogenase family)|nr:2-deoxy-D-gluconate 3-dehydrogenase [Roseibacillus sp.]MBP35650.1 2-deoxy-D-gluconate 3-dehydrogenase [Roseibacillus sp.]MCP4729975.1 SDR family oxidoreductase [Roseibacillus sp.]MDP7106364.1 SDR family oxidoreductase [Roseibacillus sp.]MDP7306173.1 SDR family oxidoreductase [Roseibacillus sp.]|tara:strand:+ start:15067 stop:15843 length:777 start_codon:yes stop_codon:yes gene_type:complete
MAYPGIKLFDLHGRTALITGGSKGLGKVIAAGLASAGANVVLVSRHGAEAQAAADEIAADHGQGTLGIEADITVPAQIDAMIATSSEFFGTIDILVNNAGINTRGPIEAITLEQFEDLMKINVTGTWLCCKTVIPLMKKAGWGRIINMSSAIGLVGVPERTPYASSKGAVSQLTRTLALELAGSGILVNAICPGPFLTEINAPLANSEEARKFIIDRTALRRWGELPEIQGAALYLASEAASYTTGSMLCVDGGWTAQ